MTTVLLVRHGETSWNAERRLQGWAPVPLSERGREQAHRLAVGLADRYAIDAMVSSDLRRARETADILADRLGFDVSPDPRWRERGLGVLQGLTYDALDERHPEYSLSAVGEAAVDARPEDGESVADQQDRVLDAWDRLIAGASVDETHLVVTHGGPIYLVLGHLLDRPIVESVLETSQDNCAVNEIRIDGESVAVVRENDTALR